MNHRQDGLALVVVTVVMALTSALTFTALDRGLFSLRITERAVDRAEVFELAEAALATAAESPQRFARTPLQPDPGGDRTAWVEQLPTAGRPVSPSGFLLENTRAHVLVEALEDGYRLTSLARDHRGQVTIVLQSVQSASGEQRIWRQLR